MTSKLGRMVRALREARGWTQRDLARKAKVTQGYVAQLELAMRQNPSLEILRRLAKALGIPLSELLPERTGKALRIYRFGGNEFVNCSLPLVFGGRYFIAEPSEEGTTLVSVVVDTGADQPGFEVVKNQPAAGSLAKVTKTTSGIITVSDAQTGRFLYKVRPGSETSIVFGAIAGPEIQARITDKRIQVGGVVLENNVFNGVRAGVVIEEMGRLKIGGPIPPRLQQWFSRGGR